MSNFLHKKKQKLLAVFLALAMLSTLAPLDAMAGYWSPQPQEPDDGYYYVHTGATKRPSDSGGGLSLNNLLVSGGGSSPYPIQQYQLQDEAERWEAFFAYCSDFDTPAVAYAKYRRIPIESVQGETGFFSGGQATAEQLRSILMNSDLWLTGNAGLEQMRKNANLLDLTMSEVQAATQIAIWNLVNGTEPTSRPTIAETAYDNRNVRDYYTYLLNLAGTPADNLAQIEVTGVTKELVPGSSNYQVTLDYVIAGEGIDPDALKNSSVAVDTAYYVIGQREEPASYESIGSEINGRGSYLFKDIPIGAQLYVTLTTTQDDVNSVYIFEPEGGRGNSQTLVTVVKDTVTLATDVEVISPGDLVNLTIFKDWLSSASGPVISNAAAGTYKATFRITYHGGGFDGVQVCDDVTITGNGSVTLGYLFEEGKSYKIEELAAPLVTPLATEQYFKVEQGEIIWTDQDGATIGSGNTTRFQNVVEIETGKVRIQKTLKDNLGDPQMEFAFTVFWKADENGSFTLYGNETYELYDAEGRLIGSFRTDEWGKFALKGGQAAVFDGLPAGSVVQVTEEENASYDLVAQPGPVTVAKDETRQIAFVNAYQVGSLVIEKAFAGALSAADFPDGIVLDIVGPNGETYEATLNAENLWRTALTDIAVGNYTITERNAGVDGFACTTTVTGGTIADNVIGVSMTKGEETKLTIINSYRERLGQLVVSKTVDDDGTAADVSGMTFTFTVYDGKNDAVSSVTLKHNESHTFTLKPGAYKVVETWSDIPALVNHFITVTVDGVATSEASREVTVTDQGTTTVAFKNTYADQSGSLKITKSLLPAMPIPQGVDYVFTIQGPDGYSKTVTLKNGYTEETILGLKPGNYTITEAAPAEHGIVNYRYIETTINGEAGQSATVTVVDNTQTTVSVVNKYERKTAELSFTKTFDEVGGTSGTASFTVGIVVDGRSDTSTIYKYKVNGGAEQNLGTNRRISGIGHNDEVTIYGLPVGAVVTVSEVADSLYNVTVDAGAGYSFTATMVEGINDSHTFANTRKTLNLTLTKLLAGADWADFPNGITFHITGPAGWDGTGLPTPVTLVPEKPNTYEFVIKSSTPVTFTGLPAGAYSIVEVNGALDGFRHTLSGTTSGTLTADREFTLTNTYVRIVGNLVITKTFLNATNGHQFVFEVTFNEPFPSGFDRTEIKATISRATGSGYDPLVLDWQNAQSFRFTLENVNGSTRTITITGIPAGMTGKVSEIGFKDGEGNDVSGQYETVPDQTFTVDSGQNVNLTFQNKAKSDVELKVFKLTAGTDFDADASFEFTITVNGRPWAGDYSIDSGPVQTSTGGVFKLKAGQVATFTGLPRGAAVVIRETANPNYTVNNSMDTGATASWTLGLEGTSEQVTFTNTRKVGARLTVTKDVTGTARDEFTQTPFAFILERQLTNDSWVPVNAAGYTVGSGNYVTDAQGRFTLKHGDTAVFEGLLTGNYRITEVEIDAGPGIDHTTPDAQTKVLGNETAITFSFTNVFNYRTGTLKVMKVVNHDNPNWLAFPKSSFSFDLYRVVEGGSDEKIGSHTVEAGKTLEIDGLRNGKYYIVEADASVTGYRWNVTYDKGSEDNPVTVDSLQEKEEIPLITMTNRYNLETADLKVSKTVRVSAGLTGGTPFDHEFTFTLYHGSTVGEGIPVTNTAYTVGGSTGTTTDENGQFILKHGETAAFENLPAGSYYVIEGKYEVDGYRRIGDTATTLTGNTGPGETIAFKNAYTRQVGDLSVSKTVTGDYYGADDPWRFQFEITGPSDWNMADWVVSGRTEMMEGKLILTLSNEVSAHTFEGLPGGTYIIKEVTPTDIPGYAFTVTVNGAAVNEAQVAVGGEAASVGFVNNYREQVGKIAIAKRVEGISYDDLNGDRLSFTLQRQVEGKWVYDSTLSPFTGSWDAVIDLPEGRYRLQEDIASAAIDKYSFMGVEYSYSGTGYAEITDGWVVFEVKDGDDVDVTITATNSYDKDSAKLRVTKKVDGYVDPEEVFLFQISGGNIDGARPYTVYDSNGNLSGNSTTTKEGQFSLKPGEVVEFYDLDTGEIYTVAEIGTGEKHSFKNAEVYSFRQVPREEGVSLENYTRIGTEDVDPTISGRMALIDNEGLLPGLEFVFTNERLTGDLQVSKHFMGFLTTDPFVVHVFFDAVEDIKDLNLILPDNAYLVDAVEGERPYVVLMIAAGEKATISGIPAGLHYTVVEAEGASYGVSYDGEQGTIPPNETALCTVENELLFGKVQVTKSVRGIDTEEVFIIQLTFTAPDGIAWTEETLEHYFTTTGNVRLAHGDIVVSAGLGHNETLDISDIPVGSTYVVEELDVEDYITHISYYDGVVDRPHASGSGGKGQPELDLITVFNFYIPYDSLVITKDVSATAGNPMHTTKFGFRLELFEPGEGSGRYEERLLQSLEAYYDDYDALVEKLEQAKAVLNNLLQEGQEEPDDKDGLSGGDSGQNHGRSTEEAEMPEEFEVPEVSEGSDHSGTSGEEADNQADGQNPEETGSDGDLENEGDNRKDEKPSESLIESDEEFKQETDGEDPNDEQEGEIHVVTGSSIVAQRTRGADEPQESQEIAAARKEVERLTALLAKLEEIGDKLNRGIYVEYDDETFEITFDSSDGGYLDFTLNLDDVFAWEEKSGTAVPLSLEEIEFKAVEEEITGEDGRSQTVNYYTFKLAKGQFLRIDHLPVGTRYLVTETEDHGAVLTYTGNSGNVTSSGEGAQGNLAAFLNTFTPDQGSLRVIKAWSGSSDTTPVTIELMIDGESTGQFITLSEETGWTGGFDGLELGRTYSVRESPVPENYKVSYSTTGITLEYGNRNSESITVTNTRDDPTEKPDKGSLRVVKVWSGGASTTPVTIELMLDGGSTGKSITLSEETGWTGRFDGLELGKIYSVRETPVPANYKVSYSSSGITLEYGNRDSETITVTNTRDDPTDKPDKGSLRVVKVWSGSIRTTPVTIELMMDGQPTGNVITLSEETDWAGGFDELELGRTYSVRETPVPANYKVSYSTTGIVIEYENKDAETITVTNTRDNGNGGRDRDRGRNDDPETPETDLPEPEVPLTPADPEPEEVPEPEIPEEVLTDPEVPLSAVPQTGESLSLYAWWTAMLLSAAGILVLLFRRKPNGKDL